MTIEENFQQALHYCYQSYRQLPRLFLEEKIEISQAFTHVALLKKQTVRDAEKKLYEEKKNWDDARFYSHETLYAEHDYVDLYALFSPLRGAEKRPDDVVVWGRAGIGKSVLCQYIATQWSQSESLPRLKNEFKAVIWLKLREVINVLSKMMYRAGTKMSLFGRC